MPDGEVTNHMVMARTKAEKKQANEESPKKTSVGYPFIFVEKITRRKMPKEIQTAPDGTENTVQRTPE